MIAAATESHGMRDAPGRHRSVVYALLTNNNNLGEFGDDIVVKYDDETGQWISYGNPVEAYNG
jgi:hypothetical protein